MHDTLNASLALHCDTSTIAASLMPYYVRTAYKHVLNGKVQLLYYTRILGKVGCMAETVLSCLARMDAALKPVHG